MSKEVIKCKVTDERIVDLKDMKKEILEEAIRQAIEEFCKENE